MNLPTRSIENSGPQPLARKVDWLLATGIRSSRESSFSGVEWGVEPIPTTKICVVFFSVIVPHAGCCKDDLIVINYKLLAPFSSLPGHGNLHSAFLLKAPSMDEPT